MAVSNAAIDTYSWALVVFALSAGSWYRAAAAAAETASFRRFSAISSFSSIRCLRAALERIISSRVYSTATRETDHARELLRTHNSINKLRVGTEVDADADACSQPTANCLRWTPTLYAAEFRRLKEKSAGRVGLFVWPANNGESYTCTPHAHNIDNGC